MPDTTTICLSGDRVIPAGYAVLPRGTVRRIRLNTAFMRDETCKPWRVIEDGVTTLYDDVIVHGTSYTRTDYELGKDEKSGCDIVRPCGWIETECDIFVR